MLNIVVPMAGRGSRFANAGYKLPKPLILLLNKCILLSKLKKIMQ